MQLKKNWVVLHCNFTYFTYLKWHLF